MATTTQTPATDYGTTTPRQHSISRTAICLNHVVHLISVIIVMSIAAYFIAGYPNGTHLVYWVSIASIDTLLTFIAIGLVLVKSHKGYLFPLHLIFSHLWLTAFIFAAQDYGYNQCRFYSPVWLGGCSLKRTLQAFAFIAFITNIIGTVLEVRLFGFRHLSGTPAVHNTEPKHTAVPATGAHHDGTTVV